MATLFAGTNNWQGIASTTAAGLMNLAGSWVARIKAAGCKTVLIDMLDRTTNTPTMSNPDAAGNTYDNDAILTNAAFRAGWKQAGFDAFVDVGTDPNLGALGAANSTTYFYDKVHPLGPGHNAIGAGLACVVDAINGSTPSAMDPVYLTATSGTLTCAQGGETFNASAASVVWTLKSAQYRTGKEVKYCNAMPSASTNTVTLNAPSDSPLNNVSGTTSITITAGTCVTLTPTWNGLTNSSAGAFWRTY